jgi:hypothetical protein
MQVQEIVRETHQDVKLVLSRVDDTVGLPRADQLRVRHLFSLPIGRNLIFRNMHR